MKSISYLKMLIILALLVFIAARMQQEEQRTGTEWLSYGYNALEGNPHSTSGIDPGIKRIPLFEIQKGENAPGTTFSEERTEQQYSNTKNIDTESTYHTELSSDAKVDGNLNLVAFSLSPDYKYVKDNTAQNKNYFQEEKATNKVFRLTMNPSQSPLLVQKIAEQVKSLPVYSKGNKEYCNFFNTYGTHCFSYIVFGQRYGMRRQLSTSYTQKSSGHTAKLGGSVSAKDATISSVGGNMGFGRTSSDTNSVQKDKVISFTIGGNLDVKEIDQWIKENRLSKPMPIEYQVFPLDQCLGWTNVKSQLKDDAKIGHIRKALENYCYDCHSTDTNCRSLFEENTFYRIRNVWTDKCISAENNGNILTSECKPGVSSQCWKSLMKSVGNESMQVLQWKNGDKYLNRPGVLLSNDLKLTDKPSGYQASYRFTLSSTPGEYLIKTTKAAEVAWKYDACIKPEKSDKAAGMKIHASQCKDKPKERWYLELCD